MRAIVGIAALLWLLVGGGTEFEPTAPSTPDPGRAVLTSYTGTVVVKGDPTHLKQFPSPETPKGSVTAILPQLVPGLLTPETLPTLAATAGWLVDRLLQSERDPPRRLGTVESGQDLLTRFCIARC